MSSSTYTPLTAATTHTPNWQPIVLALAPLDPIGFCCFRQKRSLHLYCVTKCLIYGILSTVITMTMAVLSQRPTEWRDWTADGHWKNTEQELSRAMHSFIAMLLVVVWFWMFTIYGALIFMLHRMMESESREGTQIQESERL